MSGCSQKSVNGEESQDMSDAAWEEPSDLIIEQIEIGPMQNHTYLIGCRSTREVVLVDPAWDIDSLVNHINEKDYTLTAALATHYHLSLIHI